MGERWGDVFRGSVYEFYNNRSKDSPLFQEDSHFTDDTILTFATADALMTGHDGNHDFAATYRECGKKNTSSYSLRLQD